MQERHERQWNQILEQSKSIHPSDRADYIQTWAKAYGLPSSYYKVIYRNISHRGANGFTLHDFTTNNKPTFRE